MKKFITTLSLCFLLMDILSASNYVCASYSREDGCRVVGGGHNDGYYSGSRGAKTFNQTCSDFSTGSFLDVKIGMTMPPEVAIEAAVAYGYKTSCGMTYGVSLEGQYGEHPAVFVGLASSYEFTFLRMYTTLFYPIVGAEVGFGGMKIDYNDRWCAFPHAGYKAGFAFEPFPGRIAVGAVYSGNYNFAIESLAPKSESFWQHSVCIFTRVYL